MQRDAHHQRLRGALAQHLVVGVLVLLRRSQLLELREFVAQIHAGGKFTDITEWAGIAAGGYGVGVAVGDIDNDGDLDLFVTNIGQQNSALYRNNGDGTFTDVTRATVPYTTWFSMGADAGDLNNDLLPDFLIADMAATTHYKSKTTMGAMGGLNLKRAVGSSPPQYMRNTLLINTGTGRFLEGARLFGVSSTDWTWSVKFADFDLDGEVSRFAAASARAPVFRQLFLQIQVQAIAADGQMDLFEFMLQKIVRRNLDLHFRRTNPPPIEIRHLPEAAPEASAILSAFAALSGAPGSPGHQQALAAANHALQEHAIRWTPELTTVSLDRIDAALDRFDRAVPMVKKQLLYACAATVFADGDVSNHEAELLRAVADTIGCPVPPYHHPALS